jgi:hypothetical protein
MSNSLDELQHFTCPKCSRSFESRIWLIIDEAEYPQLLDKVKQGDIYSVNCPDCRHEVMLNTPLLVVQRDRDPRLIYAVAEGKSLKEDREHLRRLIAILRHNQQNEWLVEWEKQISVIPQELLSHYLCTSSFG